MEVRNMFKQLFGGKSQPVNSVVYTTLNDNYPAIYRWKGEMWDMDTVRTCVDAIARNACKLKGKHLINGVEKADKSRIDHLLSVRPNIYMNAADFLYKMAAQREIYNNAFAFINWRGGEIEGIYPINFSQAVMREVEGRLYVAFLFMGGQQMTLPYSDLIHLRKHFCVDDFKGDSNDNAFKPIAELVEQTNKGIASAVANSGRIRGILKFSGALRPEDIQKQKDQFVASYLSTANSGGIAATDAKADFVQTNINPTMVDAGQMELIRENAYRYFGVSENIIQSKYSETEWDAFYESIIEPFALQMSLECTDKLFTERERGFGNSVMFEANRLQYVSTRTKISLLRELAPLGLFTINEGREIFNLAPVEGGDKRIQTLNVVDADKANEYQLGEEDKNGTEE